MSVSQEAMMDDPDSAQTPDVDRHMAQSVCGAPELVGTKGKSLASSWLDEVQGLTLSDPQCQSP